jgi:malate dehydrogenase
MSSPLRFVIIDLKLPLQTMGVVKIHPLGNITAEEKALVSAAIPELAANIQTVRNLICNLLRIWIDVYKL